MSNPKSNSAPTNTRRRQYRIGQVSISEINRVLQDIGLRLDQVDAIGQDPDIKGRILRNISPKSLAKHAVVHQDGGADEISIAALSGEAADEQKSAWTKVSGKPLTFDPTPHHASHEPGGADEITFPTDHAADHENGGVDEISITGLSGEAADEQKSAWTKVSGKPITLTESTAVLADNKLTRGDGGSRNIQESTISVSDNGEMLNPSQPAFRAYLNTTQVDVTGDGTNFSITGAIWTEIYDQGNNFSNGAFTAPVDGKYLFTATLDTGGYLAANNYLVLFFILSNGNYVATVLNPYACSYGGYLTFSASIEVKMDANDTCNILLAVLNGTKCIDIAANTTYIQGHLIC